MNLLCLLLKVTKHKSHRVHTVWHNIFAGVYFLLIGDFLCFAGTNLTDWFFLLGINFCDFQKVRSAQS